MVQTVCMPGKFATLCRRLSHDQRRIVEEIGLGSLLYIPSMPIQRMLVEKLVKNLNIGDRTFTIQGHVMSISPWDVYCILGLVDSGEKIETSRNVADRKWFNLYKEEGDTAITFKYLEERIPREADAGHFARMFVLYAIGTVLAPCSKGYVGSNFLDIVVDVSRIKGFNWSRFTLDHLMDNLASFRTSRRSGLAGNLALFQVWFFEHFQATGDGLDYALHQHPLIRNWDEAKVIKRARLEAIKKFGAERVVIELEPNECKAPTGIDDVDDEIDDKFNDATNDHIEEEDMNYVEQEELNQDDVHDATKSEETKMKESMKSVQSLLERFPEFHTFVQMLAKIAEGSNKATDHEAKDSEASSHCKPREQESTNHRKSDVASSVEKKNSPADLKPCLDLCDIVKREASSETSEQPNLPSGAKWKIDFVVSPTLVEKVKTRTNRQRSKVIKSPYTDIKQKRVCTNKAKGCSIEDVIKGLNLSELELHAITFVWEEFAIDPEKDIARIGGSTLKAKTMQCLLRPVKDNSTEKWLCSGIIDAYSTMFNAGWKENTEQKKYAIYDSQCQRLRKVGRDWIETGKPWFRLCCKLAQDLIGADMVFIPTNLSSSHWWLCVLVPGRNEFYVLDSFSRSSNYQEETKELRRGIHSIMQTIMASSEDLECRWHNLDILSWDVVVQKNIPRQHDICSCGIFTIKYMQYWDGRNLTNPFSQSDMETIRKKMPAELILSPLNEITNSKDHVLAIQSF